MQQAGFDVKLGTTSSDCQPNKRLSPWKHSVSPSADYSEHQMGCTQISAPCNVLLDVCKHPEWKDLAFNLASAITFQIIMFEKTEKKNCGLINTVELL